MIFFGAVVKVSGTISLSMNAFSVAIGGDDDSQNLAIKHNARMVFISILFFAKLLMN